MPYEVNHFQGTVDATFVKFVLKSDQEPSKVVALIMQNTHATQTLRVRIGNVSDYSFTLPANTGLANPLSRLVLKAPDENPFLIRYVYFSGPAATVGTTWELITVTKVDNP